MDESARGAEGAREERVAAAAHALGELAARVGNELNNPLAAVLSAHQYLRARLAAGPTAQEDPRVGYFFELVERELATMTRVVDDLRAFGTPPRIARSSFLLRDLVDEVVSEVRVPRGIAIENRVDEALSPVHLDRDACRRVLVQIARNAVEAYDAGAEGVVTIDGAIEGRDVVLTVTDRGAGIDPAILPRIRDPLYGTKAKGIGLGLAIADELARAHGGEVRCASEPGRGSTFTLRLPNR